MVWLTFLRGLALPGPVAEQTQPSSPQGLNLGFFGSWPALALFLESLHFVPPAF